MRSLLTLTDAAAKQVKSLLATREKSSLGVRISVKSRGCSGLAYSLEYVDAANPADEVVADKGVTVFVDIKATLFLAGSEMDYVDDKIKAGFVFRNPNEKGKCGCGESFYV